MKKLTHIILSILCLLQADMALARKLPPDQLRIETALGQPTMLADKKQVAYLQVGLTGFKLQHNQDRSPVNIAIVIDKSGSMNGEKIAKAKEAAIMAIGRLNSNDIISVITYDTNVKVLVPATKVSDKEMIFTHIRAINAHGSTALYGGVSKAAQEMKKFLAHGRVNRVILLSDGLANVGPQTPAELAQLGDSLIKDGISVTTIGLGLGYNEDLMTQLAYKSDGSHYFAENANDLATAFDSEFGKALSVVAQEIQIKIKCPSDIRPVRLLGREGNINGQDVELFINQLYSEHEKFIILEVEVPPTAKNTNRKIAAIDISYGNLKTGKTDKLERKAEAAFSDSTELIEQQTNHKVMANVVELIATERNELALEFRDKGNIKEAQQILFDNMSYLNDNFHRYNSPKLKRYAEEQKEDSDNMDAKNWRKQRKSMRASQFQNNYQQSEK